MIVSFSSHAWEQYLYWQKIDKKTVSKINRLIKECQRNPFEGTGKPEPLKAELSGYWSRRISHEHRLVYKITPDAIVIVQCRFHY